MWKNTYKTNLCVTYWKHNYLTKVGQKIKSLFCYLKLCIFCRTFWLSFSAWIATSYALGGPGFEFRHGLHNLCCPIFLTSSGAHTDSTSMDTDVLSREKKPGREFNHSPPTGVEVKSMWSYTSTPPYASIAQRGKILFFFRHVFIVQWNTKFINSKSEEYRIIL
jgi:hypothetical protein